VCFDVIGGDVTVTLAAEAGQLQLNVFEPVIAFRLLRNISSLANACTMLRERCIAGITANPDRMRALVEQSIGIVTALLPALGYDRCTEVARAAQESGRGVYELVLERGWMSRAELDRALNPATMTGGAG
jgi:aspartate ammonia-lyase